jgi:hypothetical protein
VRELYNLVFEDATTRFWRRIFLTVPLNLSQNPINYGRGVRA